MRKRRKENRSLPERWQRHHGAIYYRVPTGMEAAWDGKRRFRLGRNIAEAYQTWAARVGPLDEVHTIGQLLDRYAKEEVPLKAPSTQRDNLASIAKLRPVFGHMPIQSLKPAHAYKYFSERSAKTAAKHEIQVLRHALTKAVEWGLLDRNPLLKQLRLKTGPGRDRYVEDWEVEAALSIKPLRKRGSVRMLQAYIKLKLLTGLRRTDLLMLRMQDVDKDGPGIVVRPHKTARTTGKRGTYTWTDDLRAAVDEAIAARPVDIGPWLFCNRRGQPYFNEKTGKANGFDSIWQRFMNRVVAETEVAERFAERDLRAKCATDAESLDRARQILQHASDKTTRRWYMRKNEIIEPAKRRW